jgi:hypothetical protein
MVTATESEGRSPWSAGSYGGIIHTEHHSYRDPQPRILSSECPSIVACDDLGIVNRDIQSWVQLAACIGISLYNIDFRVHTVTIL